MEAAWISTRVGVATLAVLLAGAGDPVARAVEVRTIVLTGDDAPGAPFGQAFATLQFLPDSETAPVVDEDGRVAFNSISPLGVWIGDGVGLEQGLVSQAPAPVLGGQIVNVFNVWRGGSRRFVYRVTVLQGLTSSFEVLYAAGPAGFEVISEEGMDAPGTPGVFDFGPEHAPQAGGGGEAAFSGELERDVGGVTRDDDQGIWAGGAGSPLTLLLREGDPSPGFDPLAAERCTPTPDGSGADPATPIERLQPRGVVLARDGTLAMIATVADCVGPGSTRDVLWIRTPGALPRVVLVSNTEFAGTGEMVNGIGDIAISDSGIVAFTGTDFFGGGLWTASFATIGPFEELVGELVARQGDVFPGIPPGSTMQTPGVQPVVADTGRVTFDGILRNVGSEDDTGLFAAGGGLPDFTFGVEGAPAPGLPGAVFGDFEDDVVFATDAAGNVAFLMTLVAAEAGAAVGAIPVPVTPSVGLWRSGPTGPVELIAYTGGELEVRGGAKRIVKQLSLAGEGGEEGERGGGIGPDGEVAFWAEFEDDSQGIFVSVPEPGVFARRLGVLLALVPLVRRRSATSRPQRPW